MRKAIGGEEVVTFNVGINDLGQAGRSYMNGTCGGTENEGGLRAVVIRRVVRLISLPLPLKGSTTAPGFGEPFTGELLRIPLPRTS